MNRHAEESLGTVGLARFAPEVGGVCGGYRKSHFWLFSRRTCLLLRHSRAGGNPGGLSTVAWIPACAGMTMGKHLRGRWEGGQARRQNHF